MFVRQTYISRAKVLKDLCSPRRRRRKRALKFCTVRGPFGVRLVHDAYFGDSVQRDRFGWDALRRFDRALVEDYFEEGLRSQKEAEAQAAAEVLAWLERCEADSRLGDKNGKVNS